MCVYTAAPQSQRSPLGSRYDGTTVAFLQAVRARAETLERAETHVCHRRVRVCVMRTKPAGAWTKLQNSQFHIYRVSASEERKYNSCLLPRR